MRKFISVLFALVLALILSLMTAVPVSAAAAVTPANATISADIAADAASPDWADLGAITIAEQIDGDIAASQTDVTLILNAPSGFVFNDAQTPCINAAAGDITALTLTSITASAITVTFTTDAAADAGLDSIVIGQTTAIQVRPTTGVLPATGNILRDAGSTSSIAGIDGSTNFGTLTMLAGAASQLVYTVKPASTTAGMETSVFTVQRQDQFTNPVTSGALIVGLASTSDGAAKEFRATSGGVAVAQVTITDTTSTVDFYYYDEKTGTWTITASAGILSPAVTALTVNPDLKNKLAFVQQPTSAVAGVVIAPAVTVAIQDTYGNQTSDTDNITIAIGTNPGGGTLSGTLMVAALNGVATFSNLSIDKVGTGYTLVATSGALTQATSNPFNITPGALVSFTITGTPAGVLAGTAFPSPITVTAYDACLNVKTDYTGTVIWSSSASASLPVNYTFDGGDAGVHIFPGSEFTLFSTGTHTITVTDAAVFKTSSGIAVTAVIGGGWVPPAPTPTIETNLFGEVFRFRTTTTGEIRETIEATSADGNLTLTIPAGTIALDKDGNPLSTLTSDVDVSPPPPPSHIIGLAYNFGPDGAAFDPAITLTWSYDPDALPEGVAEEDLVILYYDEEAGEWVECDFTCAPETDCITGYVCHFTTFAIIAHAAPAAFSASNLSIQPSEVQPKEVVTITLSVANTGGTEGSYAVVLKINDVKEAEKDVTVAAGASEEVTFTTAKDVAGSYSVAVNGLSGSFTVKEPVPTPAPPPAPPPPAPEAINWWLIGGIIAAVVVVGLLIFFLVVRRRA